MTETTETTGNAASSRLRLQRIDGVVFEENEAVYAVSYGQQYLGNLYEEDVHESQHRERRCRADAELESWLRMMRGEIDRYEQSFPVWHSEWWSNIESARHALEEVFASGIIIRADKGEDDGEWRDCRDISVMVLAADGSNAAEAHGYAIEGGLRSVPWDASQLPCPACGCTESGVHIRHVDVFMTGEHWLTNCRATGADGWRIQRGLPPVRVDDKLNPSARREGIVIRVECESCPAISEYALAQNKGPTYVWARCIGADDDAAALPSESQLGNG